MVAHDADGFHRQDGGERLPDRVIKPVFVDLVDINGVSTAQEVELFRGDLSRAADRQTGTGEGVAGDERGRQAKFAAKGADLILEQFAQGFDQLQPHFLGQAADIVVAFDGDRGTA